MFVKCGDSLQREIVFNDVSGREFTPLENRDIFEEYYRTNDGIVFAVNPKALSSETALSDVFEIFHFVYSKVNAIGPSVRIDVPIAVVCTRADATGIDDGGVRDFLLDRGQEKFVKLAEAIFTDVRYFSVSSVDRGCLSAVRPVWWIAGKADPAFVKAMPMDGATGSTTN